MASAGSRADEQAFKCSICLSVFEKPVSLPCGHNFCLECITNYWGFSNPHVQCPVCRRMFATRPMLHVNTLIAEMTEKTKGTVPEESPGTVKQAGTVVLCSVCTGAKVKALKSCLQCVTSYCETHLEPHETVSTLKKHKLINPVKNLAHKICNIHGGYLELFCFADQEFVCEACRNRDHKTHKLVTLEEAVQMIKTQLEKEKMQEALAKMETTVMTGVRMLCDPDLKEKQRHAVDVTLDPDTANPYLKVSADGKQVTHGAKNRNLSDTPGRFDQVFNVLAKDGFSSGMFYYEVQVKDKTHWILGVVNQSIKRKGDLQLSPKIGYWTICLKKGLQYTVNTSPATNLDVRKKVHRVGVFMDYKEGQVSFYDVDARVNIFSFSGCNFTEQLFPFFSPCPNDGIKNSAPLVISPVKYNS
ncbi:E3 ubiquitin-protein ligase TRIM39-like [Scophthalmus maximus]|uniref:E3 ubiquitin-protein ligase TRIM39-like n=1 Tax=Scophthalmus maximus TaxID=52904 RepID=UPI001FA86E59|nr:E3 ubiquitin-protein ligase TRIM39-like [Scophthalmus maximus]